MLTLTCYFGKRFSTSLALHALARSGPLAWQLGDILFIATPAKQSKEGGVTKRSNFPLWPVPEAEREGTDQVVRKGGEIIYRAALPAPASLSQLPSSYPPGWGSSLASSKREKAERGLRSRDEHFTAPFIYTIVTFPLMTCGLVILYYTQANPPLQPVLCSYSSLSDSSSLIILFGYNRRSTDP